MASFTLKHPATAAQYHLNQNEDEVASLLRTVGYDGFSTTNISGFLKIHNGGLNLEIADGEWVILIGASVTTLANDRFVELFSAAE